MSIPVHTRPKHMTTNSANSFYASTLEELQNPYVRDLAVACFGPPLALPVATNLPPALQTQMTEPDRNKLLALDRHPAPLIAHLQKRTSTRLGLYFESLWAFFWSHFVQPAPANNAVIAQNLQIQKSGKTLGALDFIICEEGKGVCHIEAALKFYLLDGDNPQDLKSWVGPNRNDTLHNKVERLEHHQFKMLHHPETEIALKQLGINPQSVKQQLLLKGQLFPRLSIQTHSAQTKTMNSGNFWLAHHELLETLPEGSFTIIPRNRWISPTRHHPCVQPLRKSQLAMALTGHFSVNQRPRLVAKLEKQKVTGCWQEVSRFFVVPDYWAE